MTLITDVSQFQKLNLLDTKTSIQSFRKILPTLCKMTAMIASKITHLPPKEVTNEISSIRLPKLASLILSYVK
jgi:hypothetical protein